MKRIVLAVAITAGIVGLLAARRSMQRGDVPDAPDGSWQLAGDSPAA